MFSEIVIKYFTAFIINILMINTSGLGKPAFFNYNISQTQNKSNQKGKIKWYSEAIMLWVPELNGGSSDAESK